MKTLARIFAAVWLMAALLAAEFDRWGWFILALLIAFLLWRYSRDRPRYTRDPCQLCYGAGWYLDRDWPCPRCDGTGLDPKEQY